MNSQKNVDRSELSLKTNFLHYTYRVFWSVEDEEFVGLCVEFPSLSYLDENHLAALSGITDLVKDVIADMEANGESIPEPFANKEYSGKFQIRIPPELHRKLAIEAAEAKVSLNRYVSNKLAS
ncbi:HicB family protein (plasmid) [Stanieria sp. NIES-3757]|nr:HicB family protein [Stanieria sp. NIES-3757]